MRLRSCGCPTMSEAYLLGALVEASSSLPAMRGMR